MKASEYLLDYLDGNVTAEEFDPPAKIRANNAISGVLLQRPKNHCKIGEDEAANIVAIAIKRLKAVGD